MLMSCLILNKNSKIHNVLDTQRCVIYGKFTYNRSCFLREETLISSSCLRICNIATTNIK